MGNLLVSPPTITTTTTTTTTTGKASASDIARLGMQGRLRVTGYKFRECVNFSYAFDFTSSTWQGYYDVQDKARTQGLPLLRDSFVPGLSDPHASPSKVRI